MQQITKLLQTNGQTTQVTSTTTGKQPTFSDHEKDMAGYFWLRMSNVYGATKMQTTWPDEKTLKLAKMEYAKTIGKFSRDQIHDAFETVKRERQAGNDKFTWPDVDAILGLLTREGEMTGSWGTGAHKIFTPERRLEDLFVKERKKVSGNEELKKIKTILR